MLAVLSLRAGVVDQQFFWAWLILLGVFIVDASVTLLRRALRLENVTLAHSTHAYQHAARRYGSHQWVIFGVMLMNVFWLWPMAWFVAVGQFSGFMMLIIAYMPLIALSVYFNAGNAA